MRAQALVLPFNKFNASLERIPVMSVTAHTDSIDELFTLVAGDQTWASLLAAAYPGMHLGHELFQWEVISGGPVAISKKVMAAVTDGAQKAVGQGDVEQATVRRAVNGALIHFFDDAGGSVIRVVASNR
jgi:hypothetical protein